MKILALIPARSGSKRIHNKNIAMLGGKPLLVWSIETAKHTKLIDEVIVSSDSDEYLDIAAASGAQDLKRPDELARDESGDIGVVLHCLEFFPADLVIYLRPSTPFRDLDMVYSAIRQMKDNFKTYSGLRSVEEMTESAYKCYGINNYLKPILFQFEDLTDQANHLCPRTFHPNGYVDICKASQLEYGNLWGDRIFPFVTPRTVEIDTPEDLEYARFKIERGL